MLPRTQITACQNILLWWQEWMDGVDVPQYGDSIQDLLIMLLIWLH